MKICINCALHFSNFFFLYLSKRRFICAGQWEEINTRYGKGSIRERSIRESNTKRERSIRGRSQYKKPCMGDGRHFMQNAGLLTRRLFFRNIRISTWQVGFPARIRLMRYSRSLLFALCGAFHRCIRPSPHRERVQSSAIYLTFRGCLTLLRDSSKRYRTPIPESGGHRLEVVNLMFQKISSEHRQSKSELNVSH